jgi:hypothetical protein
MPKKSRYESVRKPIRREQARSRIGSVADRPDRGRPGADPKFAVKLWSVPGAAAALVEVQALAPRLSSLLYDLAVPERSLHALLDWAEAAVEPGSLAAFELPRLQAVLPAMLTVFIATHTYRMADLGDGPALVLDDTGHGSVVARIMALSTEVIAPLHGEEGRHLGETSRRDLGENLMKIIETIERQ